MKHEKWRPIKGFPYSVSSRGRVRRDLAENNTWVGRILKPKADKDGYLIVRLCRNGISYDRKVHALVCRAFNGPALDNAIDRGLHGRTASGGSHSRALFSNKTIRALRVAYNKAKRNAQSTGKQYVPRGFIDQLAKKYRVDRSSLHRILSGYGYKGKLNHDLVLRYG